MDDHVYDHMIVGRFGAPHGVKGWLKAVSFTEPADNLLGYRPWHVADGRGWRTLEVEAVRREGGACVVRVAGVGDRAAAQALCGREIAVPASILPALARDEYYWRDLIGLAVVDTEGRMLGHVERIMATGANDVLVVSGAPRELLIPFVRGVVTEVDLSGGRLIADWEEP